MNDIFSIILFWIIIYLAMQFFRLLTLMIIKNLPDFCPFCIATTITCIFGLLRKWNIAYITLIIGINLFDYVIRYKYYLKAKNFKYADYAKQFILVVASIIIMILLRWFYG